MNKKQALIGANELMEMYKQGFLDGYLITHIDEDPIKAWQKIKKKAARVFEYRFKTKRELKK